MLTEEALILLVTIGASGMLVLGALELAWPSRPRRAPRRARLTPPAAWDSRTSRPAVEPTVEPPLEAVEEIAAAEAVAPSAVVAAPVEPEAVVRDARAPAAVAPPEHAPVIAQAPSVSTEEPAAPQPPVSPRSATPITAQPPTSRRAGSGPKTPRTPRTVEWRRVAAAPAAAPATGEPLRTMEPVRLVEPAIDEPVVPIAAVETAAVEPELAIVAPDPLRLVEEPARVEAVAAEPARPPVLPIETCLAMYREHRYAEVVSLGSAALEVHAGMAAVSNRSDEAAALQDLVGLSKQEMGDREGARTAFSAAIAGADAQVRPTYVRHLLTLVRGVVEGVNVRDDDGVRMRELRGCLGAVETALATVPDDESLAAVQKAVREALTKLCEQLVARAVEDEGDAAARDLVLEVLADDAMPAPWRDKLREQLAAASSAEIGQLTAYAIRAVQEGKDADALDALERAERLAGSLPGGAVAEERREELDRRLWWGYTKVGLRRVETKKFEGALEPLFRALRLGALDEERLSESRAALVRALDGLVDARWPEIQRRGADDP
ncbi:MAG TPA: hypothetical protein VEA38_14160, partial [Terriglobales bacterium]|nr:hypothetical protein [Terriglobales bacterium]